MRQPLEDRMSDLLRQRREMGEYRQLTLAGGKIDLASNDYLGLSRSAWIADRVEQSLGENSLKNGSTGSRLLTGNSEELEALEQRIADFHCSEAALLFSSGFSANAGLIETVCRKGDTVLYDTAVHASLRQGMRLSAAECIGFAHNDVDDLVRLLEQHQKPSGEGAAFVIVESVYSMDGDHAPLKAIAALKDKFDFNLIIDEAHALGVFGEKGRGMCEENDIHRHCFARVYTFGKALGMHGACIAGSHTLKNYLINYCKPFIYSTAPDRRFTAAVEHSYNYLLKFEYQRFKLNMLIDKFKDVFADLPGYEITGQGPVFGLICGSPEKARRTAAHLNDCGFDVRPIVYPTVPRGRERLRISLHSFNTEAELKYLYECLRNYRL